MHESPATLIMPYGGSLINFFADESHQNDWIKYSNSLPKIKLTERNVCDFELLANGAFSPLQGFMGKNDYLNVLYEMRLQNGTLFPIPITLSINAFKELKTGGDYTLVDLHNNPLAIIKAEEIYEWNKQEEAQLIYGTTNLNIHLLQKCKPGGNSI